MVTPERFELPTCGLGNHRSIHLSYGATFFKELLSIDLCRLSVSHGWRPLSLLALLKRPCLNILARDSFRRQIVEKLADNLELDFELVAMLGRVALVVGATP